MIRLHEVVKEFRAPLGRRASAVRALDGVSLEVPPGTALGIAGPNGAGKSTLLRLLLGYVRPTAGRATVGGLLPREFVERHGIAYVSELIAIPPAWTVLGALQAFAALGEVRDERRRIEVLLERLEIGALRDRRVGALSKGNLQRLALAQALLGPRRVMILDEPSHGLDPEWTARLRELIAEWRAEDPERVLLLASHNLVEMERSVERVAVLRAGRLCTVLEAAVPPVLRLELSGVDGGAVREVLPAARPVAGRDGTFELPPGAAGAASAALGRLLARGAVLHTLAEVHTPLESRVRAALLQSGGGAA